MSLERGDFGKNCDWTRKRLLKPANALTESFRLLPNRKYRITVRPKHLGQCCPSEESFQWKRWNDYVHVVIVIL